MKIGRHDIGKPFQPYIIAEIGVNHGGSLDLAKRLIDEAAQGGADAAKFQSYKAELIASRTSPAYWDRSQEPTPSQFELFKKYDMFGPDEYRELARHCSGAGVDFLSTPFDLQAVEYLAPLMPAFKIASADITNLPLLRKVAAMGKPVILSTGASTLPEIEFAVEQLRSHGCRELALLHCVLNYPTPVKNAQLAMITTLQRVFPDCVIGYSDHVAPDATISSLEAALLLGAAILEKHFTHDKSLPGNDHYHAMDRVDLASFLEKAETYRMLVGGPGKALEHEQAARLHARRSIVARSTILKGELFSEDNLIVKRPGHGISPIHWDQIIGRRAAADVREDDLLTWPDIGDE